jgi:undecaprenyl diphosphate synthase
MLFDSEYAEYYFSEKLWPDYNEEELNKTLDSFKKSKRNF